MTKITKCLNEWNAVVEALGEAKQTILIRNYNTNLEEFILYPTVSYALKAATHDFKEDYLESFQPKYKEFVKKNALPESENSKNFKFKVKFYAKVEKIIEKPASRIGSLKNYYIWTPKHVKSYIKSSTCHIWVLRVFKLKKPVMVERTRGMKYANLLKPVSLEGIEPVLSDSEFNRIIDEI